MREQHRWHQKELAAYAHVPRSWLSRLELGDIAAPGAQRMDALARVFGVSTHYLLTGARGDEPEVVAVPVPRDRLSRIRQFIDLPARWQDRALVVADALRREVANDNEDGEDSGDSPAGRAS